MRFICEHSKNDAYEEILYPLFKTFEAGNQNGCERISQPTPPADTRLSYAIRPRLSGGTGVMPGVERIRAELKK